MTDINALSRAELTALVVETLAARGIEVVLVGGSCVPLHKRALRFLTIPFGLQIHINNFTILIHSSPQIMLLAIDLNGPAHRRRLHQ